MPRVIQTMSTIIVNRTVSRLVGQITFLSSAMMSLKNLNLKPCFLAVSTFPLVAIWPPYVASECGSEDNISLALIAVVVLSVLGSRISPLLALGASKMNDASNVTLLGHLLYYSIMRVNAPAPTVLPPSLMANLSPCSIATGLINSMVILTSSPGIAISIPSGSLIAPVTSVVLM